MNLQKALDYAIDNESGVDPAISMFLERELQAVWSRLLSAPDEYIFTRDEFGLFNYFRQRFMGNQIAHNATQRFWNHYRTHLQESETQTSGCHHNSDVAGVAEHVSMSGEDDISRVQSTASKDVSQDTLREHRKFLLRRHPRLIRRQSLPPNADALGQAQSHISAILRDETYGGWKSHQGIHQLGSVLSEIDELRSLHATALICLGQERMKRKYERILKTYFSKLQEEAQTSIDSGVTSMLESHSRRLLVVHQVVFETKSSKEFLSMLRTQDEMQIGHRPEEIDARWLETDYDTEDECEETESHTEILGIPALGERNEVNKFLRRPIPFQTLTWDLRLMILPTSVKEILEKTPRKCISVSFTNQASFMDRSKVFLERHTGFEWDWWPLLPPIPDVSPETPLLHWEVSMVLGHGTI